MDAVPHAPRDGAAIRGEWAFAVGGAVLATGVMLLLTTLRFGAYRLPTVLANPDADEQRYAAMAAHPLSAAALVHDAPFCWRILTPWIVHVLPLSERNGFLLLNSVFIVIALTFTYAWLRSAGLGRSIALVGCAGLCAIYRGSWVLLWDPYQTDPVGLAAIAVGMYLLASRDYVWLSAVMAVGVAGKESALFLAVPLVVGELRHARDARRLLAGLARAAAVCLPAVVVLAVVHLTLRPDDSYSMAALLRSLPGLRVPTLHLTPAHRLIYDAWNYTFGTFGVLLLPAGMLLVLRSARFPAARGSHWADALSLLVPALASAALVTYTQRGVLYAFPAVLLGLCVVAERVAGPRRSAVAAGALVLLQMACVVGNITTADVSLRLDIPVMAGALAAGMLAWWQLSSRPLQTAAP